MRNFYAASICPMTGASSSVVMFEIEASAPNPKQIQRCGSSGRRNDVAPLARPGVDHLRQGGL